MLNIIVTRLFPCIIFSLSRIEANLFQLHDIISISIDICVWKNSFLDSFVSRNYSKNFYPEIGLRLLKNSTYHFARTRDRILLKFVFKNQNHGASWLLTRLLVRISVKLVVGFAMPVQVSGQILSYGQNVQFQYMLPNNATFFTNYFEDLSRRRRRASWSERVPVYDILQRELDM